MATSRAYHYGGSETYNPSSGTVQLNVQRGRLQIVDPTAGGVTVRMPDARHFAYTGWAVMVVVNPSANTLTLQDFDGNSLGTIAATTIVRFGLTNNSSSAGVWTQTATTVSSVTAPRSDYICFPGGSGLVDNIRYDPDLDTWDTGIDRPLVATAGGSWTSNGDGLSHGGTTTALRRELREYSVDAWVTRSSSTNIQNNGPTSGMANKGMCYHDGASTVEEWDDTDTWTSKSSYYSSDPISAGTASGIEADGLVYVSIGGSTGGFSGDTWIEHDPILDTYAAKTEPVGSDFRQYAAQFMTAQQYHHLTGGTDGSDYFDLHAIYDTDTSTWSVGVVMPARGRHQASHTLTSDDDKGIIAQGQWRPQPATGDPAYVWDDATLVWAELSGTPVLQHASENNDAMAVTHP